LHAESALGRTVGSIFLTPFLEVRIETLGTCPVLTIKGAPLGDEPCRIALDGFCWAWTVGAEGAWLWSFCLWWVYLPYSGEKMVHGNVHGDANRGAYIGGEVRSITLKSLKGN